MVSVIVCRVSCGCARLRTQSGVAEPARAYQSGREGSTIVVKRMQATILSSSSVTKTFHTLHTCTSTVPFPKTGSPLRSYPVWRTSIAWDIRPFDVRRELPELSAVLAIAME